MPVPANPLTTSMAVMPHRDVDRALEMAMSLDIPYLIKAKNKPCILRAPSLLKQR
jgi:hypothetical protein